MPRFGRALACIAIFPLVFGCDDSERIERWPLRVYSIEHPDSLQVGHADTLEVGANP